MGSSLPTSSLAVFDLLAADSLLAPLVGSYLWSNGQTRPAIAHLWRNEDLGPEVVARGVEIVVWRVGSDDPVPCVSGEVIVNPTISLAITQWEPATAGGAMQLEAVVRRVQKLLPGASAADVSVPGLTVGLQQQAVRWRCPVLVV
jgi:hypothetical protein